MRNCSWINKSEFILVFDWITSNDCTQRRLALDRIQAWRSRAKVPLAVQATFDFVDIQLLDYDKIVSDDALRLLYSMAMIRFVNGILDQEQGLAVKSMMGLAESMGLPTWFVEIRHSATHDQLPLLELLRTAANQALDWIYRHYWSCQYTLSKEELSSFFHHLIGQDRNSRDKMIHEIITRISDGSELIMFIDSILDCDPGSLRIWEDAFKLLEKEWKGFTLDVFKRIIETKRKSRKIEKWASWLAGHNLIKENLKYVLGLLAKESLSDFTILLYQVLSRNCPEVQRVFGTILAFVDDIDINYCDFSETASNGELEEFYQRIQQLCADSKAVSSMDVGFTRWSRAVEFEWDAPIGCLPNGTVPNLDLNLLDHDPYVSLLELHSESQFTVDKVALI
jgi:hypothetical protein